MQETREAALPATSPTSLVGDTHLHHRRGVNPLAIAWHAALVLVALWLFVIALQLIKNGAGGLKPVLDAFAVEGVLGHLGFGWIGSYLVMSGSPVAAVSLSLFSGGIQDDLETFAMINGSRLGASLIVLVVGFVSYVTGRRNPDGLYIGVVALLVAITLWTPVVPIGVLILNQGWLDGVSIESPGALTSAVNYISDPVVKPIVDVLPEGLLFVAGIATLIGAFTVFDRALPQLEAPGERIEKLSRTLQHRYAMFLFGTLVTLVTLSVSLSVTILVPLALKGYVHRDRVIPYVMGANIATWIDTLFAALLLNSPQAFTIVLTEMIAGAGVSLFVLFFLYGPYNRFILGAAHRVSSSRGHMAGFLAFLLVAPLVLIGIGAVRGML
jgi:hypothetical protein